jgi:hypothetical protein
MAGENEALKVVSFQMKMVYQGAEYEDPNAPVEDDAAKKKGKGAGEPEGPKMIVPDPIYITNESGREFEI